LRGVDPGVDPEELWALGERLGYATAIRWSATSGPGAFDVVFAASAGGDPRAVPIVVRAQPPLREWRHYANDPREHQAACSPRQLRERLARQLPDSMVPSAFVPLTSLPLTPSGKLDRRALPRPDASSLATSRPFVPPTTDREAELAGIWRDILKLEQVGIDDDIFELGGDSLLIFGLTVKANERGWRITPRDVFAQRTIRQLAKLGADDAADSGAAPEPDRAKTAPADFPLAKLSQSQLDSVFAAMSRGAN
jgi:hypothetical protein